MTPTLYLIIPCYNEEKVLPLTAPLFLQEITLLTEKNLISEQSRIMFIDDGSRDKTWEIITRLSKENESIVASVRAATVGIRMRF